MVGAKYVRDVMPGEIVLIDENGIKSIKYDETKIERQCLFERIYFARPDSVVKGNTVYTYRKNLGLELAREWQESGNCPTKNEAKNTVVVPIPDSGVPGSAWFFSIYKM